MNRLLAISGKALEILGMLLMPLALFLGIQLEGSGGMTLELLVMTAGILVFMAGRGLGALAGSRS